jgi:hypothetical protein
MAIMGGALPQGLIITFMNFLRLFNQTTKITPELRHREESELPVELEVFPCLDPFLCVPAHTFARGLD